MSYAVGKDVISYCGRCKLKLSHLIIALKADGVPAKVQCKTCSSSRSYSPDKPQTQKRKAVRKRAKSIPLKEVWEAKLTELNKDPVKYSIRGNFCLDDVIDHPKFGIGFVSGTFNQKIEVTFSGDIKELVHNK